MNTITLTPLISTLLCLSCVIFFPVVSVAQVNMETFVTKKPIKNHVLDAAYTFQNGISEAQNIKINYRFDSKDPSWRWLTVAEWNQDLYSKGAGTNQGLLHLRSMLRLDKSTEWEHFTQQQWDALQELSNRFLIGTGLRWTWQQEVGTSALGTGLMYENELYQTGLSANKLRMTSYFNISTLFQAVTLSTTTYFQPTLDHWEDYRILNRNTLTFYFNPDFFIRLSANLDYKGILVSKSDTYWSTRIVTTLGVQF